MKIYIAGSSNELERAETAISVANGAGMVVTFDWTRLVREVGDANPKAATQSQKQHWAWNDLEGVKLADLFWLLTPKTHSVGAWVEMGFAIAQNIPVIASPMPGSIFGGIAHFFDSDKLAFEEILLRAAAGKELEAVRHRNATPNS